MPGMEGDGATEHLHRYVLARQLATGLDVLDIACGEGYGSAMLAQVARSCIGIDIDLESVTHAKNKYQAANLEFHHGECAHLPLDDACVDLVVSFETIEHHDQHSEMMREIRRVLRPDGVLLISSPNKPEFNRDRFEPYPFHVKELDYNEFDALLRTEFSKVEFYGQRSLTGSLVAPLDDRNASFSDFDSSLEGGLGINRSIYFLVLAGNAALPELGVSVFEGHQTRNIFKTAPAVREIRVYFACDGDAGYEQARSHGVSYPENREHQSITLSLSAGSKINKIRLDLSSAPSAVLLHGIYLQQGDGAVLWQWDGATSSFVNMGGLTIRSTPAGLLLLCWNDDPHFDLVLPPDALAGLQFNARLVVDLTPHPLLEICADVFRQDDRLIADLRAAVHRDSMADTAALSSKLQFQVSSLTKNLENVTVWLKRSLEQRDQTIAEQTIRLASMRDELLRAEAQLALLKDVMRHLGKT